MHPEFTLVDQINSKLMDAEQAWRKIADKHPDRKEWALGRADGLKDARRTVSILALNELGRKVRP